MLHTFSRTLVCKKSFTVALLHSRRNEDKARNKTITSLQVCFHCTFEWLTTAQAREPRAEEGSCSSLHIIGGASNPAPLIS